MVRYFRLYLCFLRFSFSRAMEFRFDFFFRVAMDIVFYAVHIAFFRIIYLHTGALGGWNLDQMMIFVAGFLFMDALYMTVTANNCWILPFHINGGHLDYYLARPVSSLFFLTFREFAANSFLNLMIAAGILAWALGRYPGELGGVRVSLFLAGLIIGNILHVLLVLNFIIPVFWMQSGEGLREIFFTFTHFSDRPHQIYPNWLQRVLTSILPLALIVSLPAHILFSGLTWGRFLNIAVVLAALWSFTIWFWRRGLRAYSSASS